MQKLQLLSPMKMQGGGQNLAIFAAKKVRVMISSSSKADKKTPPQKLRGFAVCRSTDEEHEAFDEYFLRLRPDGAKGYNFA